MRIDEIKAELLAANPKLQRGSDETGYEPITGEEYEATIQSWAEAAYAKELKAEEKAQAEAEAQAKREAALSKLAALGLTTDDLKALGL